MIEITNYRQGAILNHHHGRETDKALYVKICGISEYGCPVTVNGIDADMDGRNFCAEIPLTEKFNQVKASTITPYGVFSQDLTLVWDKKSFKRYNFYIDDHIFVFTDLAEQRPRHAFDHFYLAGLKKIHDQYGLKVTLNCFYHNDHKEFVLKDMPDIWKQEFIDNSDWLKFSFHSYGEFPDRPYAEANAEEFGRDWDLVQGEIVRFAGEQSYIPPVVIHWANIHPAVGLECVRRGMRAYCSCMRLRVMGGPSLADRMKGGNMAAVQTASMNGSDRSTGTYGMKLHYGFYEEDSYVKLHRAYYDPLIGLFYFSGSGCCCNLTPIEEIPKRYAAQMANAERLGIDLLSGASHEQYTFPYYSNYIPDHLQRIETAVRCLTEGGFAPVFYHQGVLGNTAWDK